MCMELFLKQKKTVLFPTKNNIKKGLFVTVQELIDRLSEFNKNSLVVLVCVDSDTPSMDSYTIDEVKSQYGFTAIVSVD